LSATTSTQTVNYLTLSNVITSYGGVTNTINLGGTTSTTIKVNALPQAVIIDPTPNNTKTVYATDANGTSTQTITGTITGIPDERYLFDVIDEVGTSTRSIGTISGRFNTSSTTITWSATANLSTTTSTQTIHNISIGTVSSTLVATNDQNNTSSTTTTFRINALPTASITEPSPKTVYTDANGNYATTLTGTITGIPGETYNLPIKNNGTTITTVAGTIDPSGTNTWTAS
jgi:hypothetical protein